MAKKKNKAPIMSIDDPRFKSFLMSILRRASRFWKPSDLCIEKTRLSRGVHVCPECKKTCKRKDMKKDHIDPVIPVTGFTNWDDIISRLFVKQEGWQALCVDCHDKKTKEENEKRKALKKEKAVLSYYKNKKDAD
jgi:5-methylcytosine-specific restriction endonuclease McrA